MARFIFVHRAGFTVVAPGIRSADFDFRERGRFSTRDRSRSQMPVPPESAREKRVAWKKEENDLCRCVFYARQISTLQLAGLDEYFGISCRLRGALW